jgi:hypothetical protein
MMSDEKIDWVDLAEPRAHDQCAGADVGLHRAVWHLPALTMRQRERLRMVAPLLVEAMEEVERMTTIANVLEEIRRQLEWVGPAGRGQGHIVLTRDMAEYARDLMLKVIMERDELAADNSNLNDALATCRELREYDRKELEAFRQKETPATGEGSS